MAQHGPVRLRRPVIAGLLGLAVATVATVAMWVGAPAASAVSTQTLSVTPGHGPSAASFTIAFQEPIRLLPGPCPDSVTFTFDGTVLGDAPLARKGSSCVASLRTTPVAGGGPGPHTVRAAGTSASATYTVDPAPSAAPPGPVRASPTPSGAAPSAGPSDAPGAQPAGPSATGAGTPSIEVPAGMEGRSGSAGTSATTWVLGGGALLIIADIAILALLSLRGRRGGHGGRGGHGRHERPERPLPGG